jgi:hypothetical protein
LAEFPELALRDSGRVSEVILVQVILNLVELFSN